MSDLSYPFQHFPLDPPEYREQVWLQQSPLSAIPDLLQNPHEWIRKNVAGRAPEQLLGLRKNVVTILFTYPEQGPPEGSAFIHGVLTNNIIHVSLPRGESLEADMLSLLAGEGAQEILVTLHDGLAFTLHFPKIERNQDTLLAFLSLVIRSPEDYLRILNDPARFTLTPTAPRGGEVTNASSPPASSLRLSLPAGNLSGVRFLFQWSDPEYPGPSTPSSPDEGGNAPTRQLTGENIRLSGTYDPDEPDETEVEVDTISWVPDVMAVPPPPSVGWITEPKKEDDDDDGDEGGDAP